jgi:hypothetical protein
MEKEPALSLENYRIFSRDENLDVTELYKTKGELQADESQENGPQKA